MDGRHCLRKQQLPQAIVSALIIMHEIASVTGFCLSLFSGLQQGSASAEDGRPVAESLLVEDPE